MPELQDTFDKISEVPVFDAKKMGCSSKALARLAGGASVDVHHYQEHTGETTIETIQDVSGILAANQRDYTSGQDGYSPTRDWKYVATIPCSVIDKFHHQGIDLMAPENIDMLRALLDDPEYQKFRTSSGKLSKKPKREYVGARIRSRTN